MNISWDCGDACKATEKLRSYLYFKAYVKQFFKIKTLDASLFYNSCSVLGTDIFNSFKEIMPEIIF